MSIVDHELWESLVKSNDDPYGKACMDVAKRAMEILDEEPGDLNTRELICRAVNESGEAGITGFQAGCIAKMISQIHSRGEEFRRKWNYDNQLHNEGDNANASGAVLNPAVLVGIGD